MITLVGAAVKVARGLLLRRMRGAPTLPAHGLVTEPRVPDHSRGQQQTPRDGGGGFGEGLRPSGETRDPDHDPGDKGDPHRQAPVQAYTGHPDRNREDAGRQHQRRFKPLARDQSGGEQNGHWSGDTVRHAEQRSGGAPGCWLP